MIDWIKIDSRFRSGITNMRRSFSHDNHVMISALLRSKESMVLVFHPDISKLYKAQIECIREKESKESQRAKQYANQHAPQFREGEHRQSS